MRYDWLCSLLLFAVATVCGTGGCQHTGPDGGAAAPKLGFNVVPKQTEPPLDDEGGLQTAGHDGEEEPAEAPERAEKGKPDTLLTRLLPGREKETPPRKTLPLTEKPSDEEDSGFDF